MTRRGGGRSARRYPRTARLRELFREILAEDLERIEDDRMELVTVIEVDVDAELALATVYVSGLAGPDGDAELLAALADHAPHLRRSLAAQARVKRVPELVFRIDEVGRSAARIDEVLASLPELSEEVASGSDDAGGPGPGTPDPDGEPDPAD